MRSLYKMVMYLNVFGSRVYDGSFGQLNRVNVVTVDLHRVLCFVVDVVQ